MSGSKLENNAGAGWLDGGLGQDGIASGSSRCVRSVVWCFGWHFRGFDLEALSGGGAYMERAWVHAEAGCGLFSLLSMVAAK